MYEYSKSPEEIYRLSFHRVEMALQPYLQAKPVDEAMLPIIMRMVHACGMPDLVQDMMWSKQFLPVALAEFPRLKSIFVDSHMVKEGIIQKFLSPSVKLTCTLQDESVPALARLMGNTRSAAGLELWPHDEIAQSAIVIGNAPTALFHLLERIEAGIMPEPKFIIGMPVGFVGAAESKQALMEFPFHSSEWITIQGTRGGSAIAAAALNALAKLHQ